MALEAWALLELQEAKEELGVGPTVIDDEEISDLVNAVTLDIEAYFDRRLIARAYANEVVDGSGAGTLRLENFPITAVTAVEFWDGTTWQPQDLTDLIICGARSDRISFRSIFPRGFQSIRVSYTAGVTNNDALRRLAKGTLMLRYKQRDRHLAGIASQSFPGGQTVTYRNDDFPNQIATLFKTYGRVG